MRASHRHDAIDRFRLGAGMSGVAAVTLFLLLAQLLLGGASLAGG